MNLDIKLHKKDLPEKIELSDKIAVDCEFTGLNIERDNSSTNEIIWNFLSRFNLNGLR